MNSAFMLVMKHEHIHSFHPHSSTPVSNRVSVVLFMVFVFLPNKLYSTDEY